jgi:hypothetical protein
MYLKLILICSVFLFPYFSIAQKGAIDLSENLYNNTEVLKVTMGTQWPGKIWKFQFGEYEVVSGKTGWVTTGNRASIFNRKTESITTEKFSFVLSNRSGDSAMVNAAKKVKANSLREIEILPRFSIGTNDMLSETGNFAAFINVNNDTTDTWALLMNVFSLNEDNKFYDAFLTNGNRKIIIQPVTSKDNRSIPALGYEFRENEVALCAVQYYGGGALGTNKNIIWLGKQLDEHMKLIFAAAMTALLQIKVTSPSPGL